MGREVLELKKYPNFRSSRVHVPKIPYPVMTSDVVRVNKNKPYNAESVDPRLPEEPLWHYYKVFASDNYLGFFPHQAFMHDPDSYGWLCPIVEGEEQWISIKLDNNWLIPYDYYPYKITKIEVYNADNKDHVCKQFLFQGRNFSAPWSTLRTCKVKNLEPKARSVFTVEMPDGISGYDEYRLLVQIATGEEYVGFKCINLYHIDTEHDELTWGTVGAKGRSFPWMFEKLYVKNDDADGIVWEKFHDNRMIVAGTSWYPGYYASTSFHTTIFHPNDTLYVQRPGEEIRDPYSNGPFTVSHPIYSECIFRTKNFVVCRGGSYYYSPVNSYRYTHNGKDWTKPQGGLPPGWWLGAGGGFGTNDDNGICFANGKVYRLELDGEKVNVVEMGTVGQEGIVDCGGYVGDIAFQGTYRGQHGLQYYKFMNNKGEIYESNLQAEYQYTDLSEPDPTKQVKTTGCSWTFFYAGGHYYAAEKSIDIIYYNYVTEEWMTQRRFVMVSSTDGFKSVSAGYTLDPCPDNRFVSFGFAPFNDGASLIETWVELGPDGKPTNKTHTAINGAQVEAYRDIPLIGFNSDPLYRGVRVRFSNTITVENTPKDLCLRDFSPTSNAAFLKKGQPDWPDQYVISTAFKKNDWSSGSYDEGGYIFLGAGVAYGTSNYMIDRHNYTYINILQGG